MILQAKVIRVIDVGMADGTHVLYTPEGERLAVYVEDDVLSPHAIAVREGEQATEPPRRTPPPFDPTGPTLRVGE